jgi:hypothetical protein
MFGLSTDAVEDRIPPEASPNARAVRVPIGQVANGACELSAWGGAGRVTPDEGGDIRVEFGADGDEGRGGAMAYEVVFILIFGVAELASA